MNLNKKNMSKIPNHKSATSGVLLGIVIGLILYGIIKLPEIIDLFKNFL